MIAKNSKLDHPGIAKLVAAHAKPPNYMFFFEFYELGNLAAQLHVEEWSPSIHKVLDVSSKLGEVSVFYSSVSH